MSYWICSLGKIGIFMVNKQEFRIGKKDADSGKEILGHIYAFERYISFLFEEISDLPGVNCGKLYEQVDYYSQELIKLYEKIDSLNAEIDNRFRCNINDVIAIGDIEYDIDYYNGVIIYSYDAKELQ